MYGPTIRRLKPEEVTTNAKRQAILKLLEERGVAYLREIERAVGSGFFGLKWHLQVLDDFGYVRHRQIGRHLVYYLKEFGDSDPAMVELGYLFKSETTRAIVDYIRNYPHAYQTEIARVLGLHYTTIRNHLLPLKEQELLESVLDGRRTLYILPDEKKDLVDSLLRQVKPEY